MRVLLMCFRLLGAGQSGVASTRTRDLWRHAVRRRFATIWLPFLSCARLHDGYVTGGGGYMCVVTREPNASEQLRALLAAAGIPDMVVQSAPPTLAA